jgi:hypothetical protein
VKQQNTGEPTQIRWRIAGEEFASCNCNWGCPCQFNALPTTGRCEAFACPRSCQELPFKITANHLPPPPGAPDPPVLWGDEAIVRERLGGGVSSLVLTPFMAQLRLPFSVPETVEFYRTYYGPTQKAFAALPEDKQPALRCDMENLFEQYNKATDGATCVEAEYLEVVAIRA